MISCSDWSSWTKPVYTVSLWPGDKATINGASALRLIPPQKIPRAKSHWKISHIDFFLSRRHPAYWLSSKGPNYQREELIISAGATEGHFEGNAPRAGRSPRGPGSPGTCNLQETGLPWFPLSWSPTLFSGSGPVGRLLVLWTNKYNWKFAIFRPTHRSFLPRRPDWMNKIITFLEWLAKVRATG
jgi:hypothetical protein